MHKYIKSTSASIFLNECVKHYLSRENKAIHCSAFYVPSLISCFSSILHLFFFLFCLEQETKTECGGEKLPESRGERKENGEFVNFYFLFNTDFFLCSSHSSNVQGFVDKRYKSFQESSLN